MGIEFEGLGSAHCGDSPDDDTNELTLPSPTISFQKGEREFSISLEALSLGDHYQFGRFGKRDVGEEGLHLISLPHVAPEGWETTTISRSHFEIWRHPSRGTYLIRDLGSKNGIFSRVHDGGDTSVYRPLEQEQTYELHDMSTLRIPGFGKMIFRAPNGSSTPDDER